MRLSQKSIFDDLAPSVGSCTPNRRGSRRGRRIDARADYRRCRFCRIEPSVVGVANDYRPRSRSTSTSTVMFATPNYWSLYSTGKDARFRPLSIPPLSLRMTGPRAIRRPISTSTPTARSTCLRPPAGTALTRPSYLPAQIRSMATRPTCCRWSKRKCAGKCGPTIPSPLMASTSR
jgi:hypothetical protein